MNVREYLEAMDTVDAAREVRRQFKQARSLDDSLLDAYELVEKTAFVNELEVKNVAFFNVREEA